MTLAQLRTALQARGYGTDTATTQTECINAAYREVVGDHHWSFLEAVSNAGSTAVGSTVVSGFPVADALHLREVRLWLSTTDHLNLTYLDHDTYNDLAYELGWDTNGNETKDVPVYWTVRGAGASAVIAVGPPADKIYTAKVWYINDPVDLSADGDIPALPPTYHDILVEGALAEMAARHRDWAQHDRYRARFEQRLRRMKAQLGIRQQQTSQQVQRSGFYDTYDRWPFNRRP